MRRHLVTATAALAAATASFGVLADGAVADDSSPAQPPTHHPTKHPTAAHHHHAKPTPAKATASRLYMYDAFFVHHRTVDLPGRAMHVTGFVRPYVPHQKVTLTARLGKKIIATRRLNVRATKSGKSGRFVGTVTAPTPGILHLRVTHKRSPRLQGFQAGRGAEILAPDTTSKLFTTLVQQRLAKRHIYMPVSGRWDEQTLLAIDAYHRMLGRGTSTTLDPGTLTSLLNGAGTFHVQDPQDGKHVEGDLGHQLLALIQGSKVLRIYPISSGKPSTPTILGRYHVYLRTPGYLPDGMYYSSFFVRGYAIHGYDPAPDFPASHGCMRLPISDAISVYDWLNYGDVVDVYQ